jgi:hypothetical protein
MREEKHYEKVLEGMEIYRKDFAKKKLHKEPIFTEGGGG